jgi:hypothetical protein
LIQVVSFDLGKFAEGIMSMIKRNENEDLGNTIALWRYRAKTQFKPTALVAVLLLGLVGSVPQVSGFAAAGGFGWWSIGIRSFSIHIPSIRIPRSFELPGSYWFFGRYDYDQNTGINLGINYWCKPPNYREPGAEQFRAEIDCLVRAIAARAGKAKATDRLSSRLERVRDLPEAPNLRVLTPEVAAQNGKNYDTLDAITVGDTIYLKPEHGQDYLHELLHIVYRGDRSVGVHHKDDLNEGDAAFWETEFGRRLNLTYQDIFGTPHPQKIRDTVPATPLQRIAIADCFEGLRKFLGEARFDYYDFNDFDIGGLF